MARHLASTAAQVAGLRRSIVRIDQSRKIALAVQTYYLLFGHDFGVPRIGDFRQETPIPLGDLNHRVQAGIISITNWARRKSGPKPACSGTRSPATRPPCRAAVATNSEYWSSVPKSGSIVSEIGSNQPSTDGVYCRPFRPAFCWRRSARFCSWSPGSIFLCPHGPATIPLSSHRQQGWCSGHPPAPFRRLISESTDRQEDRSTDRCPYELLP
jgi:hypothetical protein